MKSKCGYTLVEMLVVSGIILILAAISLPVFARIREKSYRTTCSNNLKHIFVSAQLYIQDNDESLPLPAHAVKNFGVPVAKGGTPNLLGALLPYIKNRDILFCPSVPSSSSIYAPTQVSNTSYMGNGVVTGRKMSTVPNPSSVIFIHEFPLRTNSFYCNPFWDEQAKNFFVNGGYSNAVAEESFNFPKSVHSEGENVLFCDGHIKWRKSDSFELREMGLVGEGSFYHRNPPEANGYSAAF